MKGAEYALEVRRVFVVKRLQVPIVRNSGKVVDRVMVPIVVRRLVLRGNFVTTAAFRCVPVVSNGEASWSVSELTQPKPERLPLAKLRREPAAKPTWKKWASMREREFLNWLGRALGPERAAQAVAELRVAGLVSAAAGHAAPVT